MRAKEEAFRILEAALSTASQGVDEAEVALGGGELGSTRFNHHGITLASEHTFETLSVRVLQGGHIVRVTTTDLSHEGIKAASEAAKSRVASFTGQPSRITFPEPQHYGEVEAYDPATEGTQGLERAAMAARAVLAAKENRLFARGLVSVTRGGMTMDGSPSLYAVANTRGLLAYHPETRVHFAVEMNRSNGGYGSAALDACSVDVMDPDGMVATVLARARHEGPRQPLAAGSYHAVLEPAAVGALLRFLGLTCGAGLAEQGGSFLAGKLDAKVAAEDIHLRDDFSHPMHKGVPFDIEGVACRPVDIIRGGVAVSPVYSWENARRLNTEATGHHQMSATSGEYEGARYLVMEGRDGVGPEGLAQTVGTGVLIPELGEVRLADSRTVRVMGVTRGLWRIEGGSLATPAPPMRFDVSVLDLLSRVVGRSESVYAQGSVVPGLAVEDFSLRPTSGF